MLGEQDRDVTLPQANRIAKTHQVRQAEGNQRNGKEVIDQVAAKVINTYWIKNIGFLSLR